MIPLKTDWIYKYTSNWVLNECSREKNNNKKMKPVTTTGVSYCHMQLHHRSEFDQGLWVGDGFSHSPNIIPQPELALESRLVVNTDWNSTHAALLYVKYWELPAQRALSTI